MKMRVKSNNKNDMLSDIPFTVCNIEKESEELLVTVKDEYDSMEAYYARMADPTLSAEEQADIRGRLASVKRANSNIRQAYVMSLSMSDEINGRWHDITKSRRKRRLIPTAPANTFVDISERSSQHFACGLNVYKLLLILFVGSFVGVAIEMLWCLLRHGYIESRAGLVYGPFNLLYGVGGVALSLALYRFRNHRRWLSFVGGFLIGSAVEYMCSLAQEILFGSRSWDYSHMPFNLNGRICLLYGVFWGILGVLWIKNLYPRLASLILKIPDKAGRVATVILTVFLVLNAAVTCTAVYRWSERKSGEAADGVFWNIVDERFNDERMEKIFANMDFGEED